MRTVAKNATTEQLNSEMLKKLKLLSNENNTTAEGGGEMNAPNECAGCYREKTCELWRNELLRAEIIADGCDLYEQNRPTNFDRITDYPGILAENLVYHHYDELNGDEWFGVTGDGIRESFKTREKAVITTLDWLGKEVEK